MQLALFASYSLIRFSSLTVSVVFPLLLCMGAISLVTLQFTQGPIESGAADCIEGR